MIKKSEFQKVDCIKNEIYLSETFNSLREQVKNLTVGNPLTIRGAAGSLLSLIAQVLYEEQPRQILLIASDVERAEKLRDDCALLMGEENVLFYGAHPEHQLSRQKMGLDLTSSITQIETLKALALGKNVLVVASPSLISEKIPSPDYFNRSIIELSVNDEYNFQSLIEQLEKNGFERKGFLESYGDFAVRGGIIDVFPFIGENPLRFEFWGNKVESIREFDVLSQRSIRELQGASIVPSLSTNSRTNEEQIENNSRGKEKSAASIFDYLHSSALVILDNPLDIESEINKLHEEGVRNLFSFNDISQYARNFLLIMHDHNLSGNANGVMDFQSKQQPSFNSSINTLVESLRHLFVDGYRVYLTCDTNEEAIRLQELIEEAITLPQDGSESKSHGLSNDLANLMPLTENISTSRSTIPSGVIDKPETVEYKIIPETLHSGFIFPSARLAVFTEHEIFNRLKRRGLVKRRRFKGFSQKELHQLKSSDYVVHIDYGIGMFDGLTKIKVGGNLQEVMKLRFVDNDVLYVNLNFVNRVQKYSSHEGHVPKMSKLGMPDWNRTKEKAKRRIKDIARNLITLYAKRKHERGFGFSSDTHWQKELEASFIYEDTVDQAHATQEVKRDMENSSPMDRLICGDVGFGKTEVAVRAAFKAVMDGKQVALLVPTTILALQHYHTFVDRLSRYTTRIENITRFKSAKDQKKIVEDLVGGSVDIIIGTHRLLSKDIMFKDLGLLIIDEEHRFGVAAKEKLRHIKATVDTLALTATPIPRTLHFSLIGAR
ncbi:MAG TPA: DEAD/DEAH box helicase, partial [Bacteroidota bacterium]|nr:DEAD/DEAH box helicase [Bacteroidota bacterium]